MKVGVRLKVKTAIIVSMVVLVFIGCVFTVKELLSPVASPQIIAIPGGQEYDSIGKFRDLKEYYVVVNPPKKLRDADAFMELIIEFDKANPIVSPPPPQDAEFIRGYSRHFFRESKAFPRDIKFTSTFRPKDILTEEYNLRDRIANINADIDGKQYQVRLIYNENAFLDVRETAYRNHAEENSDPTINGLYNNVPEHMIPKWD